MPQIDAGAYPLIPALFETAVRFGDLPAFECLGRTMSYDAVDAASRSVAAWLQQLRIERGDRVAVMVPNVFAFPVAMLGIHRAGRRR